MNAIIPDQSFISGSPSLEAVTQSPEESRLISEVLGSLLNRKTIIGLNGELGAGKTEFVKGLASGLGVPSDSYITSPTYSIINQYHGRLPLYHLDLYRLSDPDELYDTGLDDILLENAVVVVEWPSIMTEEADFDIHINIQVTGITERKITFFAYGLANSNLIRELANQFKEKK